MILDKYNTILWDFDGVILNSDKIRTDGFKHIFRSYGKKAVRTIVAYHKRNGGLSRYNKINYFFEEVLMKKVSKIEIQSFANKYSDYCFDRLCDSNLLINDSLEFIKENERKFNFHIVSASDQKELIRICKNHQIETYFKSILGSPIRKSENIKCILNDYDYSIENCCLIGDSFNDRDAALENSIDFFGYNNSDFLKQNIPYISSFKKN